MKAIQSVRGMSDLLPTEANLFLSVSNQIARIFAEYQFEPILPPIVEKTELFARSIGDATDIVEKEMYTFIDRNEESLSLRPEGTAGVVRACLEHGLIHNQIRKFWFIGPMFRHERPQKGRYRQFYQLNAEVFGIATPDIEAEVLAMQLRLWQALSVDQHLHLEINTLGTNEERQAFRQGLMAFLKPLKDRLDEDSQRRLTTNPLRILDSKDEQTQALLENAPQLNDFLSTSSCQHYERLKSYLNALNIPFRENPHLVRGLDYYSHTVFEWTTTLLGSQASVCGGGRYDGLVTQLGGQATPAFGFAMGMERLLLLLEHSHFKAQASIPDVYCIAPPSSEQEALTVAETLRTEGLLVALNCGEGSIKSQYKRADKSGAPLALSFGPNHSQFEIRYLRADKPSEHFDMKGLIQFLNQYSHKSE